MTVDEVVVQAFFLYKPEARYKEALDETRENSGVVPDFAMTG
jgi:hypothetical protein